MLNNRRKKCCRIIKKKKRHGQYKLDASLEDLASIREFLKARLKIRWLRFHSFW